MSSFRVLNDRAVQVAGSGQQVRIALTDSAGEIYVGGPSVSTSSYRQKLTTTGSASCSVAGPVWVLSSSAGGVLCSVDVRDGEAVAANPWTRFWVGGLPVAQAGGTSTTPTANRVYLGATKIDQACQLTGIGYSIGGTGGTDKAIVLLYDALGNPLAWSAVAGTTVGTADRFQELAFTTKLDVVSPGMYFIGVAYNGNTARIRLHDSSAGALGDSSTIGGYVASGVSFGSQPGPITVPTTVGACPMAYTY